MFNIVAIPSGVYRFIREGRMNWPVTWVAILGTLPGIFFGALSVPAGCPTREISSSCGVCAALYRPAPAL